MLGLLAGLTLPGLAMTLRPFLPVLIAALLCVSAFRIGPKAAYGGLHDIGQSLVIVGLYQIVAPLIALAFIVTFGVQHTAWALAILVVLSAPSVTGGANFTILLGRDPSIALRLLLLGTAVFPITAIPVLWVAPGTDGMGDVLRASGLLMAVIFGAVTAAFLMRSWSRPTLSARSVSALDGLSAILLGVVVVGLMSAVGPTLRAAPLVFLGWLAFAVALNFGLQALSVWALPLQNPQRDRTGTAIVAGNRNIALFLVALPDASMEALLIFIGCYQVPMYLTPILMRRIVAR